MKGKYIANMVFEWEIQDAKGPVRITNVLISADGLRDKVFAESIGESVGPYYLSGPMVEEIANLGIFGKLIEAYARWQYDQAQLKQMPEIKDGKIRCPSCGQWNNFDLMVVPGIGDEGELDAPDYCQRCGFYLKG